MIYLELTIQKHLHTAKGCHTCVETNHIKGLSNTTRQQHRCALKRIISNGLCCAQSSTWLNYDCTEPSDTAQITLCLKAPLGYCIIVTGHFSSYNNIFRSYHETVGRHF